MKRMLLLLLMQVTITACYSANYFEIDPINVTSSDYGKTIAVPVGASFDCCVSAWQISLILPKGLSIGDYVDDSGWSRFGVQEGDDMTIEYGGMYKYNANLICSVDDNNSNVVNILCANTGYDPGHSADNHKGVVCWKPGIYDHLFTLYLKVDETYRNKKIVLSSLTAMGYDTKYNPLTDAGNGYPRGDENQDGEINIADINTLLDYICRGASGEIQDVYQDGVVNIVDVVAIVDIIFTGEWFSGYERMVSEYSNQSLALNVKFPANIDLDKYAGMRLQITNTSNNKTAHYILTDKYQYTFSGLEQNTTWNVALMNQYGDVLGEIDNIFVGNQDVTVSFDSLLKPQNVELIVRTGMGGDMTSRTSVSWFNEQWDLLTHGAKIDGLPVGKKINYKVAFSPELIPDYVFIPPTAYTVKDGDNTILITLVESVQRSMTATVTDAISHRPIKGAIVTAVQSFDGGYAKTYHTTTDANGEYSFSLKNAHTVLTVAASNYLSQTIDLSSQGTSFTLPDVALTPITGAVLDLQLSYTPAHLPNDPPATQNGYPDYRNIDFRIFNLTTGSEITNISVQYPQIILIDGAHDGDVIQITATSIKNLFYPVVTKVTIIEQKAVAPINIVEKGKIVASYMSNENPEVIASLYGSNGGLVYSGSYSNASITFNDLDDGNYWLLTMGKSILFNNLISLSRLAATELKQDEDYLLIPVTVKNGIISSVIIDHVPFLDESKFLFTDENTAFTVNKTITVVGNYLTFRADVGFKEEYVDFINDIQIIVDLPENCSLYEGSVMLGSKVLNVTSIDNQLIIPLINCDQSVRMCAIPILSGDYVASAFVKFTFNGKEYIQPIGNAQFTATDLSLSVPPVTGVPMISVGGSANDGRTVKVYDGDVQIAQTECLANGNWRVRAELYQPVDPSVHAIHAIVETGSGFVLMTESKDVLFQKFIPQIDLIEMIYDGGSYEFDFLNGTTSPGSYTFKRSIHGFTFVTNLMGTTDSVRDLQFKILDTSWNVKTVSGHYDTEKDQWICSADYSNVNALPTSVGVDYEYVWNDTIMRYVTSFIDHTNGVTPNIQPVVEQLIDPSGFVYEGVPSNRLQGVIATCYYKNVETGLPVIWDAEQYEQHNPLLTDVNGRYRWDVPIGMWQVKYEKEGYETTYSDWLPVPPPQLDVNIGMVQMRQPEVIMAHAYPQSVELEFDKYMLPETLTTDNITVSVNGSSVSGTIELINAEVDDPNSITSVRRVPGTGLTLASRIRFNADKHFNAKKVTLIVNKDVNSYAGLSMNEDYEAVLAIEQEMEQIVVDSEVMVPFQKSKEIMITVLPAQASAGKTLNVMACAPMIASIQAEQYVLDQHGQAVVSVKGELPGMAELLFDVDGYDLSASSIISVDILDPITGDTNGDGEVNIADVNAAIDIILGSTPDEEARNRADVNGDGEINIADINALIDIILTPSTQTALNVNSNDKIHVNDLAIKPGETQFVNIMLDNASSYSAMQCDIVLPQGLTLIDVAGAHASNVIESGGVNDGTTRIAAYSMNKLPFAPDAPVMTLTVQADEQLAVESELLLHHVVLADNANNACRMADCNAQVMNSTGVNELLACNDRVWVEGRTLCINAHRDAMAQVVAISGIKMDLNVIAGVNRRILEPGFYVIVLNGNSYKVVVK